MAAKKHHAGSAGGRRNHDMRGSPKGDKVKALPIAGKPAKVIFGRDPKQAENDDVPRKMAATKHMPRQAGVAKRARNTVKRLSNRVI